MRNLFVTDDLRPFAPIDPPRPRPRPRCAVLRAHGHGLGFAPDRASRIDDMLEFAPLIIFGNVVAVDGAGEAALWAEAQIV